MKRITLTIAALSLAVFTLVLANDLMFSVIPEPGMMNPTLRVGLRTGATGILWALLGWTLISCYLAAIVAWTDAELKHLDQRLASAGGRDDGQSRAILELKDAIRDGDLEQVRRRANWLAFVPAADGLSAYELACLYQDPAVIAELRALYRRQSGGGEPPDRFRSTVAEPD